MRPALTLVSIMITSVLLSTLGARAQTAPADTVTARPALPSSDAAVSASDLAKQLQNPVGTVVSVPFQSNTNFGVGPHKGTQELLNIQPVVPVRLNENWNVITRTILPLVWNPSFEPAHTVPFGTSPLSFSAFLAPAQPVDGWIWGAGPIAQVPTASDKSLGSNVWGLGPAVVLVKLAGPIVGGLLVNNVFSLGGKPTPAATRYSALTINPFLNYNFPGGWFVGTVPIITANLDAPGAKWTLPVGAQAGRLIKLGDQPVNLVAGVYYNALRPRGGGTWQLRTQVAFIF